MRGMLAFRRTAIELLPLLVLVWATLAVLGGAAHQVVESAGLGDGVGDSAAKAGLGLCVISVALVVRWAVGRKLSPPPTTRFSQELSRPAPLPPLATPTLEWPPTGRTRLLLLRVSRT